MTESEQHEAIPFPRPLVNDDNAFLYEGFAAGELRIQRCTACQQLRVPPGPMCPGCQSMDWDTITASGKGRVHSYTVHHHPPIPPYESPHPVVLVDLAEGVRFLASMSGVLPDQIRIDMDVEIEFRKLEDDYFLPVFVPRKNVTAESGLN